MRRKRPRILGSLRNPVPPKDLSLPSDQPKNIHFFPPQTPMPQPTFRTNPLFVFYPTSFPALRNTSYFPTLMIAMPSSSCVNKLSSKHPSYFQTPSFLSTLRSTSSPRALLDSCLVPLSHLETSYFQPEEVSQKPQTRNPCRWFTSEMPKAVFLAAQHGEHGGGRMMEPAADSLYLISPDFSY